MESCPLLTWLNPFNQTQDSKPSKILSAGQQTLPNLAKSNTGQQTLPDPSNEPQDNTTVCKTIARRSRSDSGHLLTWLDPLNRTQAWLEPYNQTQNNKPRKVLSTGQQTWPGPVQSDTKQLNPFNQTQDSKPSKIPSAGQQAWPDPLPIKHKTTNLARSRL